MTNNPKKYKNIHQKLIDRCKKNDTKAQFDIYKLYYKTMFNTCLRIVNDRPEAEDIMQESFLSAFTKMRTYQGNVSFGAWLKRIVINNAIDFIKKKKIELTDIEKVKYLPEEQENLEILLEENKHTIKTIKNAMEKLSDGYRVIMSLYLFEGYDHDEIGEILEIKSSTSRSQFTRAKQKLKEIIEKT